MFGIWRYFEGLFAGNLLLGICTENWHSVVIERGWTKRSQDLADGFSL